MDTKRKALGRGLEELFNSESLELSKIENKIIEEADKDEIIEIDLSQLRSNPYQPRKIFDEEALKELSESIKEYGVFQPIIVKKSIKGFDIIAGERRVKASKMAGKTTIPAIVRDFTDEQMMQIALLENLQRENLTAIEEATAYKDIINALNITQDDLAKKLTDAMDSLKDCEGIIVLSDLAGGSPFKTAVEIGFPRGNVEVVAGTNLGMLVEINLTRTFSEDVHALAESACNVGKDQVMRYVFQHIEQNDDFSDGI